MIVKPAIKWLLAAPDAAVVFIVQTVLAGIAAHPTIFTTPIPTPVAVQAALDDFIAAQSAAALGGPAQTAMRNAKRAVLIGLMRLLANYVYAVANGDMSILLLSGFPHQKPDRTKIGDLTIPAAPQTLAGPFSGMAKAATAPVYGASSYNWRVALASAPTVYVQTTQTTAAKADFTDLTPGQTYNIEVNAVGAAGPTDYSDPGTVMPD